MPKTHAPRHGSMQYWPRVKSKKPIAKIRSWNMYSKEPVLGFIGYKAGMTHIVGIDTRKNAATKGDEITEAVTIVESPPMKIAGVRIYRTVYGKMQPATDIIFKTEKSLSRKITLPKKHHEFSQLDSINTDKVVDFRMLVYTQPKDSGLGKKKPELMELGMSGSVSDKIKFVKENHDKELLFSTFFKEGEYVDLHSVTRGKGLEGPVKRFGVAFKPHKTEKGVRRVGTLGAWSGQGHVLYRVPHPGQMGYHMRTEHNKQIFKISSKPEEINPKGAFPHYGNVKSTYVIIKGSIGGSQKRTIILTKPLRQRLMQTIPTITYISQESKN